MDDDLSGGQSPVPLNFTTVAIGIVAIVMVFGAIKGVVKLVFTLISLAGATIVAYMAYMKLPEFSSQLETPFAPTTLVYASVGIGIVTYIFTRTLVGKLFNPLALVDGKPRGRGPLGAVFGLVPAIALVWVIATAVRVTGVAEGFEQIQKEADAAGTPQNTADAPWLAKLKRYMKTDTVAGWMAKIDPFVSQGKEAIGKLLISTQNRNATSQLQGNREAVNIVNNPKFLELMHDPEIKKLIDRGDFLTLMENPKIRAAVESDELRRDLENFDVDTIHR
jgi:uncharacterized membrane protein required for colicin V production